GRSTPDALRRAHQKTTTPVALLPDRPRLTPPFTGSTGGNEHNRNYRLGFFGARAESKNHCIPGNTLRACRSHAVDATIGPAVLHAAVQAPLSRLSVPRSKGRGARRGA